MEIQELEAIIDNLAVQLSYPGFDMRSLKIGLPEAALKSPARLFRNALKHDEVLLRLAALRWFQQRPGDAKKNIDLLLLSLADADEWVRSEAVHAIEQITSVDVSAAEAVARLLQDKSSQVQKAAAKACGKFGLKSPAIIDALKLAAQSNDAEVRWKSEKALRKLGMYSNPAA